jgi:hypothetical protein
MTEFSADAFLPHVGEVFRWQAGAPEARIMRLLDVERYPRRPGLAREPFSLLFVMHDQPPLAGGVYSLLHGEFERCELLLTRVTVPKYECQDPRGMYYEAVFS